LLVLCVLVTELLADCVLVSVLLTSILDDCVLLVVIVVVLVCKVLGDREAVDVLVCVLEFVFVDVWVGLTRAIDTELVLLGD